MTFSEIRCLDKLQWDDVREIIQDVLNDTDFEVFVYYL